MISPRKKIIQKCVIGIIIRSRACISGRGGRGNRSNNSSISTINNNSKNNNICFLETFWRFYSKKVNQKS